MDSDISVRSAARLALWLCGAAEAPVTLWDDTDHSFTSLDEAAGYLSRTPKPCVLSADPDSPRLRLRQPSLSELEGHRIAIASLFGSDGLMADLARFPPEHPVVVSGAGQDLSAPLEALRVLCRDYIQVGRFSLSLKSKPDGSPLQIGLGRPAAVLHHN